MPASSDPPPSPRLYGPDGHTVRILRDTIDTPPASADRPPEVAARSAARAAPARKPSASKRARSKPSRRAAAPSAPPGDQSVMERVRERLSAGKEWLEAGAVELKGTSTVLFLWRKLGFKGLLIVLLVVGGPIGEYSAFSRFVNATLPRMAGDFGVHIDAADWSYHPFSLKAVARDVTLRPAHVRSAQPVFTAAEVEFQGTVKTVLAGMGELLTGRWARTFNEITIRNAELRLERDMTGEINWTQFVRSVPPDQRIQLASGGYRINAVAVEDLKISYVEQLRGQSGAGIIETVQANVFVDAIRGTLTGIGPFTGAGELPTHVALDGRSADGMIQVRGGLGLLPPPPPGAAGVQSASASADAPAAGPYYDLTIALANVGVGAFASMVPATRLVPVRGNLDGRVRLVNLPAKAPHPCVSELQAADVRYAPNPRLVTRPIEFEAIRKQAVGFIASGRFDVCRPPTTGFVAPPGGMRPDKKVNSATILASFNEQATASAPPALREAAALDSLAADGSITDAALKDIASKIAAGAANQVSRLLGAQSGAAVQQALDPQPSASRGAAANPAQSPVTKGVKGIGRGIKRLFGGK